MNAALDPTLDNSAPMRAGVRIATDYLLRWAVTALERHEGDLIEALVLASLSSGNQRQSNNTASHPLTVNQVAASLQLPYETVRRRFVSLHAKGMLLRSRQGFVVAALVDAEDQCEQQAEVQLRQIRRLVRDLANVGIAA